MIALKELLNDIGRKNIAIATILMVGTWVAATRYVDSVASTFAEIAIERHEIRVEIAKLHDAQQTDDYERTSAPRLTVADGAALIERISRLERRMDEVTDVRRKDAR